MACFSEFEPILSLHRQSSHRPPLMMITRSNPSHGPAEPSRERSTPRATRRPFPGIFAALIFGLCAAGFFSPSPSRAGEVVYHLNSADFDSYVTRHNDNKNIKNSVVNGANNQKALQIEVIPTASPEGYYHSVVTSPRLLQNGQEYVATVTFRVVTPTKFPGHFYMFFRNSAGNEHDLWQKWVGLPGATRTITFPVDLKSIPAANGGETAWIFYMGMKGPGALVIENFTITKGTENVVVTPKPGAPVGTAAPAGIPQATGATPFQIVPPAAPVATISTDEFHFTAEGPAATSTTPVDNAAALQRAFDACKTRGAVKMVIPKGIYHIAALNSIHLNGLNDLTLDGQGSTLMFEKLAKDGQGFVIVGCSRMRWENLAIDWNSDVLPLASLGIVSNLSADGLQCDFTFPDQNAARTELTRTSKWAALWAIDPVTLVATKGTQLPTPRADGKAATDKPNVLHVTFPTASRLVDGQTYCVRHLYYEMTAFKVVDTNNLVFNKVNIYGFPGMGWLYEAAMHHWAMIDCHVERGPHPRNPLTLAADGIHSDSSQGNFLIKDCSFTGLGDDSINLHDSCYQGTVVMDPADDKSLTLLNCPPYQLRINPGDHLEFYNADYSPLDPAKPTTREVAAVTKTPNAPNLSIKFTTPVPAGVTGISILRNLRFNNSNVCIEGCKFEYTNGRGILFSGANSTIKNCNFLRSGTPIVLETEIAPGLWEEGNGTSNILIEGNKFTDIASRTRYGRAVIYAETMLPWGTTTTPLNRSVSVINNDFVSCPGPAVSLDASANVVVRGNRIDCTRQAEDATRYSGTILAANSSHLALGGNTWIAAVPSTFASGVIYDKATTSNVFADGNILSAPTKTK